MLTTETSKKYADVKNWLNVQLQTRKAIRL